MPEKLVKDDGTEYEVYTAAEKQADVAAAIAATEATYKPKVETLETELGDAKKALGDRAIEFKQFRKLNDDQVAKLDLAQRTIYENSLVIEQNRIDKEKSDADAKVAARDVLLRSKAGTDDKLFDKMKATWDIIGVQANTPDEMENKAKMVIGALTSTEPDLIASLGSFQGGTHVPPEAKTGDQKSFADSEKGKQGAAELGLKVEVPKA